MKGTCLDDRATEAPVTKKYSHSRVVWISVEHTWIQFEPIELVRATVDYSHLCETIKRENSYTDKKFRLKRLKNQMSGVRKVKAIKAIAIK
jgi:hypothetical protein